MASQPYRPGTIKIDPPVFSSSSEQVRARLERIAGNYRLLEQLISDLEARLPSPSPAEPVENLHVADQVSQSKQEFDRRHRRKPR